MTIDRRNLVLLAYYYLPDNTSGVQRAVRMAKFLPENGYDTYVVSSSHKGALPGIQQVMHVPGPLTAINRVKRQERIAAKIQKLLLPYDDRLPWVPHAVEAVHALMAKKPVSVIVSTAPPLATHLAALWLKRRHDIRWIADFRDPLYGNPGRSRRWGRPYDRAIERTIFQHADIVLAVTDTVCEQWKRDYPQWEAKFHLIWNGFDPSEGFRAAPLPPRPYRVLTHAGVLYRLRHPNKVLASIERLISQGHLNPESLRLRFVGHIEAEAEFRAFPPVTSLAARGCLQMDGATIPREAAMQEIATADFLFLIDIVNLDNIGYTVPAKLYDYLLVGRPILTITAPGSPVDRILGKSGVPYTCVYHADTDEEIDRKLNEFFRLSSEAVMPSPWFFDQFDGRRQAATLGAMLDSLDRKPVPASRP
jgi:hypothetical protein